MEPHDLRWMAEDEFDALIRPNRKLAAMARVVREATRLAIARVLDANRESGAAYDLSRNARYPFRMARFTLQGHESG
jgi:hypothetical protein